jgi:gliding-associated putative ABC transporter substrate-binding component GldG
MSPEIFNQGSQPLAYLLEGQFSSVFKNRFIPEGYDQADFMESSDKTAMIVCSDGDIIRNEMNPKTGMPYDLGYEPFLQVEFANRDFIINSLSYLVDGNDLILSRTKEIAIRPLDKIKVEDQKLQWQIINLVVPVLMVIFYGFIRNYYRKRKYAA